MTSQGGASIVTSSLHLTRCCESTLSSYSDHDHHNRPYHKARLFLVSLTLTGGGEALVVTSHTFPGVSLRTSLAVSLIEPSSSPLESISSTSSK